MSSILSAHAVRRRALGIAALLGAGLVALAGPLAAQTAAPRSNDAEFERKATLSKELGATHIVVTEGLPLARWEMDPKDPYPMWFVHHATLLKIYPPKSVQPYVNMPYAQQVSGIIAQRCALLRRLGLKAVWNGNEPAVMPEAFFAAYPQLRGPRIDHPARATKPHYAPNVDEPETLAMYREAIQSLVTACPELDLMNWTTTDAGSGFDWTPGLYPGSNGNAKWRDRPISDRVAGFLINAQQAAKAAGHDIQINVNQISPRQWMIPTFSVDVVENTTRKLPAGLALNGRQGPDGRAFSSRGGGGGVGGAFYPVVGLSAPSMDSAPGGRASPAPDGSPRVLFNLGDPTTIDFNYRLRKFTAGRPMATFAERAATLRAFAATEVGEAQADNLMDYWNNLNDVSDILNVLDFGGMLKFGHVLNRWVSRPMVPFPEKLTDADKADYRPYLFQAKGEDQANNLIDIQAMRMYEGWGAKMLFQRDIELALPKVERNIRLAEGFKAAATTDAGKAQWDLTAKRLQALVYLLESADDMVDYQAQLDRVKVLGVKPEANPPLAAQSSWDRTDLMDTARKEIDIMVSLERLLASTDAPILDLASSPQDETIQKLGPNLRAQIRHKVDIMNHHWRDYDQLFTVPNP
jgi:hypothetical protein